MFHRKSGFGACDNMKDCSLRGYDAIRRIVFLVAILLTAMSVELSASLETDRVSDSALFEKKLEYARTRAARASDEAFADSIRPGNTRSGRVESVGLAGLLVRIAGYLSLVAVLIVAIAWFLRRSGARGGNSVGGATDVVETLSIGQGRHVTLVRIQDIILVVGHTPHSVALLDRIEGQKAVELIAAGKGGTSIEQFKDVFSTFVGKMKKSS